MLDKGIKNLTVYHGSYTKVLNPDLNKCQNGKDFGKGFYVTTDKAQAERFALIVAKRKGMKSGVINTYTVSDLEGIDIYEFLNTDADWLRCVIGNRDKKYKNMSLKWDGYDVCVGKIADDDTSQVINAYMAGAYGEINSEKAISLAVEMFMPRRLNDQICFRTDKAIKKISFVSSEEVSNEK